MWVGSPPRVREFSLMSGLHRSDYSQGQVGFSRSTRIFQKVQIDQRKRNFEERARATKVWDNWFISAKHEFGQLLLCLFACPTQIGTWKDLEDVLHQDFKDCRPDFFLREQAAAAAEKLEETGLDLSLALSAQPHASAPHNSSAGGPGCATPSNSAVTTVPVAGTTTTTASWQQAFKQSGDLRADIQNLVHLPQKTAAARHAHKCSHDHSHSTNQL